MEAKIDTNIRMQAKIVKSKHRGKYQ